MKKKIFVLVLPLTLLSVYCLFRFTRTEPELVPPVTKREPKNSLKTVLQENEVLLVNEPVFLKISEDKTSITIENTETLVTNVILLERPASKIIKSDNSHHIILVDTSDYSEFSTLYQVDPTSCGLKKISDFKGNTYSFWINELENTILFSNGLIFSSTVSQTDIFNAIELDHRFGMQGQFFKSGDVLSILSGGSALRGGPSAYFLLPYDQKKARLITEISLDFIPQKHAAIYAHYNESTNRTTIIATDGKIYFRELDGTLSTQTWLTESDQYYHSLESYTNQNILIRCVHLNEPISKLFSFTFELNGKVTFQSIEVYSIVTAFQKISGEYRIVDAQGKHKVISQKANNKKE